MYPTFPLITPEIDTPCLAIMRSGSLKYRGTRDADLLLNKSRLSISPENTSVTSKFDTLKQRQYGLELCLFGPFKRHRRKFVYQCPVNPGLLWLENSGFIPP